jgi:predicted DNA-binding transcriptional regulator AlpA
MERHARTPGDNIEPLWDVHDFALFLNASVKSAYRIIESPDGPPVIRLGPRRVRLNPALVREWIETRQER